MQQPRTITHDPVYYITVAFFVLLTTALPALLGQVRFMPFIQTLALTIFVAIPLNHRHLRGALLVMTLWLALQYVTLVAITLFFDQQVERAIPDGFAVRAAFTGWYYDGAPLFDGLFSSARGLTSLIGVILGSLLTAGLVGFWFLVRVLNLSAFGTGVLITLMDSPVELLRVLPYWTLLRLAAYGTLVVLLAQPLLTYTWSPTTYWRSQRPLILTAAGLLLASILLELLLPGLLAHTGSV